MLIQLSRNWWWLALRGIAAILFGIVALAWRGDTLGSFMLLFAGFALAEGILVGLAALINRSAKQRWWILLQGFVSVATAIFSFARPEVAASILLYLVATWALITALVQWAGAKRLEQDVSNEQLLQRSAMISIVFAVLVILLPRTGVLSVAQMFAAFAIPFGLLMWTLSLNLRNMGKYAQAMSHSSTDLPSTFVK